MPSAEPVTASALRRPRSAPDGTGGQCVTWHGLMLAASTWRAWNNRGQRKENMQRVTANIFIGTDDDIQASSDPTQFVIWAGDLAMIHFDHGTADKIREFKAALDVLLDRMAESEERADAEEERLAEENETGAMRCPVRE